VGEGAALEALAERVSWRNAEGGGRRADR